MSARDDQRTGRDYSIVIEIYGKSHLETTRAFTRDTRKAAAAAATRWAKKFFLSVADRTTVEVVAGCREYWEFH
jgi:hypothetical protein